MTSEVKDYILRRKDSLAQYIRTMTIYMEAKKDISDYHGVRDAVVDIEVAEAKISAFNEILRLL